MSRSLVLAALLALATAQQPIDLRSLVDNSAAIACDSTTPGNTASGAHVFGLLSRDIFYRLHVTATTRYSMHTCGHDDTGAQGPGIDTILMLYADENLTAVSTAICANDDFDSPISNVGDPRICTRVPADACGATDQFNSGFEVVLAPGYYVVVVEAYGGATTAGPYTLQLSCNTSPDALTTEAPPPPLQDFVDSSPQIFCPDMGYGRYSGNNANGSHYLGFASSENYYRFRVTEPARVTLDTCNHNGLPTAANRDTTLRLYSMAANDDVLTPDAEPLCANDDYANQITGATCGRVSASACSDPDDALHAGFNVLLAAGEYVVLVEGWGNNVGPYTLQVVCDTTPDALTTEAPLPPIEDAINAADALACNTVVPGTTVGGAHYFGRSSVETLYTFEVTEASLVEMHTCLEAANSIDTILLLFTRQQILDGGSNPAAVDPLCRNDDWQGWQPAGGPCTPIPATSCTSSASNAALNSGMQSVLQPGVYVVAVESYGDAAGNYSLSTSCSSPNPTSSPTVTFAPTVSPSPAPPLGTQIDTAPVLTCNGDQASGDTSTGAHYFGFAGALDHFYTFELATEQQVVLSTCGHDTSGQGADIDTVLYLFRNEDTPSTITVDTPFTCRNDDHLGGVNTINGTCSRAPADLCAQDERFNSGLLAVLPAGSYLVVVEGFGRQNGVYTVGLTCSAATNAPTTSPNNVPTAPPNNVPTAPPNNVPTAPPINVPTAPPNNLPTAPPNRPPTTMSPSPLLPTTTAPTDIDASFSPTGSPASSNPTTLQPTSTPTSTPTTMPPTTMPPTTMPPTTMPPTAPPTTPPPTMPPTMPPTIPGGSADSNSASGNKGGDDKSGSKTKIAVLIAAIIVVIVALVAGVFVYKKFYSGSAAMTGVRSSANASFDNPLYDHADNMGIMSGGASTANSSTGLYASVEETGATNNSGYMDVPAAAQAGDGGHSGYMDVSANGGYDDDDLEDV